MVPGHSKSVSLLLILRVLAVKVKMEFLGVQKDLFFCIFVSVLLCLKYAGMCWLPGVFWLQMIALGTLLQPRLEKDMELEAEGCWRLSCVSVDELLYVSACMLDLNCMSQRIKATMYPGTEELL